MSKQQKSAPQHHQELTGLERLGLRVSAMINSPLAQLGRRVLIHRLDTDAEEDWKEVMGLLADTPELDLTFNDDESVMVRWERSAQDLNDIIIEQEREKVGEGAPFYRVDNSELPPIAD